MGRPKQDSSGRASRQMKRRGRDSSTEKTGKKGGYVQGYGVTYPWSSRLVLEPGSNGDSKSEKGAVSKHANNGPGCLGGSGKCRNHACIDVRRELSRRHDSSLRRE